MVDRFYNTFSIGEKLLSSIQFDAKRRNFYDDRILLNWKYIFENFAQFCQPCKIVFSGINNDIIQKVLYITTNDRKFATEFMFYKHQLLERLNTYFGTEKSRFVDIKMKILS